MGRFTHTISPVCTGCGAISDGSNAYCPCCGTAILLTRLPVDTPRPDLSSEFRPAVVLDYGMAAVIGLIAVAATLPFSVMFIIDLRFRTDPAEVLLVASWNGWIWGLPILIAAARWRIAALAGVFDHTHLIHTFWRCQAVVVALPLGYLLVAAFVAALSS